MHAGTISWQTIISHKYIMLCWNKLQPSRSGHLLNKPCPLPQYIILGVFVQTLLYLFISERPQATRPVIYLNVVGHPVEPEAQVPHGLIEMVTVVENIQQTLYKTVLSDCNKVQRQLTKIPTYIVKLLHLMCTSAVFTLQSLV